MFLAQQNNEQYALDRLTGILRLYRSRGIGRIENNITCTRHHRQLYYILNQMLLDFTVTSHPLDKSVYVFMKPYTALKFNVVMQNMLSIAPFYTSVNLKTIFVSVQMFRNVSRGPDYSICAYVLEVLGTHASEREANELTVEYLERYLRSRELKVIFVVDQPELFFATDTPFNKNSIGEIIHLNGIRGCGHILLLLCTEWMRFRRFFGDVFPISDEYDQFPLARIYSGAGVTLRVVVQEYPHPDDLAHILASLHPTDQIDDPRTVTIYNQYTKVEIAEARRVMYFCGIGSRDSPRQHGVDEVILPTNHVGVDIWKALLCLWFGSVDNRRLMFRLPLIPIYKQRMREVFRYGKWGRYPNAIENLEWEGLFQPIRRSLVFDQFHGRHYEFEYWVFYLAQNGYVIVAGDDIYPASLWMLEKNLVFYGAMLVRLFAYHCGDFEIPESLRGILSLTSYGERLLRKGLKYLRQVHKPRAN